MAAYPPHRFVQEFARRTHQNIRDIKVDRPASFHDTALISSLLAVFVLPHERADDPTFMADLLADYDQRALHEIVTVLRTNRTTEAGGDADPTSLPSSIGEIPRFLRNAVAHMNVRPESADGSTLTHLLVWNTSNRSKRTTFVARVHVARLRGLALHVLERLASSAIGDRYDGIDPIAKFDADHPRLAGDKGGS